MLSQKLFDGKLSGRRTAPTWPSKTESEIDRLSSIKYAKRSIYADEQGLNQATSSTAQKSADQLALSQSQPKLAQIKLKMESEAKSPVAPKKIKVKTVDSENINIEDSEKYLMKNLISRVS